MLQKYTIFKLAVDEKFRNLYLYLSTSRIHYEKLQNVAKFYIEFEKDLL